MIALDTNILVYAHRRDCQWHKRAQAAIRELAEGTGSWAIPWPCLHEFLAIVTHPRIYSPPSTVTQAIDQIEAWLTSPTLELLGEQPGYWNVIRQTVQQAQISGPQIHDARVAALCAHHGVRELWTADRDFNRFAQISVRNPLV